MMDPGVEIALIVSCGTCFGNKSSCGAGDEACGGGNVESLPSLFAASGNADQLFVVS